MAEEMTKMQDKALTADIAKGVLRWLKGRSIAASNVLNGKGSGSLPPDQLELRDSRPARALGRTINMCSSGSSPATARVPSGTGPLPLIEDDQDLVPLLRQASNEELDPLVKYIIEKGGVTAQLHRTQRYRQYSATGDHSKYADDIAAEIQKFGANTVWTNAIRKGRGIKYGKILRKVAKRCGVKAGWLDETTEIEERMLMAVLSRAYDKMTEVQRHELLCTLEIHGLPGSSGLAGTAALQTVIQAAGFAPYKLAVIVANATANAVLGHGLAFAANAGLTKAVALFAGPVGWVFDAAWGGTIAAGPAYRVILPCVVQVALIRQSMLRKQRRRSFRVLRIVALIALACILVLLVARYLMR
jgi:uncharacterized protein YaaW (UPF0174 family)